MSGKEFLYWKLLREFQKELEQLKQDIEARYEIRRKLEEYKQNPR